MKPFNLLFTIFIFLIICSSIRADQESVMNNTDENEYIYIFKNFVYRDNEAWDRYDRLTRTGYEEFYVVEHEEYVVISKYQTVSYNRSTEIIDYLGIPDTFNGKPVKIIGRAAFYEVKIKTLKLPAYLEIIERNAFWGSNVENILFNNTLKTIGEEAFTLSHIKNLIIPDSVTRIDRGAFSPNWIENLIIGNGIKTISESAFFYGSISTVILPETLEVIEELAFSGNPIEKIIIPDSVYRIGRSAFSSLNEIIIGDNVELVLGTFYTELNKFIEFYYENNRRGGKYIMEYRRVYDGAEEYWEYEEI
jgi:hypothetical protein